MRGRLPVWIAGAVLCLSTAVAAEPTPPKDPAHALANKFSQGEQSATKPARPSLDYEMEMLKRARAEAASRSPTAPPVKVAPPAAEAASVLPPQTPAVAAPALENKPAVKAEAPPTAHPPTAAPPSPPRVEAKVDDKPGAVPQTAKTSPRATVLLVIEPAHETSGPEPAPPDPIICLGEVCYVSTGLDTPARKISRTEAVALKSTSDIGATACKNMSGCIFRDVALKTGATLEVIEVGASTAIKREATDISADETCSVSEGDLICENPVSAPDHRIWIVPEETARTAGVTMIEDAVAFGLLEDDITRDTDK